MMFEPARTFVVVLMLAIAAVSSADAADAPDPSAGICGEIYTRHYGPYDYRTERDRLRIVEEAHFSPQIQALAGSEWDLAGNLNYTLKSAPNHHRALVAVVRFGEKFKSEQTEHLEFPIECYFNRALRFRPDDTVVRALYAQYLGKRGRKADAIQQLDAAIPLAVENPLSQYNIGLVFFELKEYQRALQQAQRAREMGFERPELMEQLRKVGLKPDDAASTAEGRAR